MDGMSKLGFLAVELLMIKEERTFNPRADIALICFNSSSSLNTDRQYHKSIFLDSYYPRPSLFVYTLPNIVTGEIAIRNKITGETSFYIFPEYNPEQIVRTVRQTLDGKPGHTAITGWIEYSDNVHEALMMQVSNRQESSADIPFSPEKAGELMQHLRSITINQ
jgi:3-oxoacyl-[acyl-carrier-protein] synthase-1